MGAGSAVAVLRDIQTLFDTGTASGLTDRQLLDRFVSRRDAAGEAAFEVLVLRHGPMVLRVCQNLLRDPNDSLDAFQATFLVLVRRCGSIRKLDSVGGWLYGVACRVAARARVDAARRRSAEARAALRVVEAVEPSDTEETVELAYGPIVQDEVRRLPEKYRDVVVLCYWQGLTHEQAAAQLGCPLGTVRSRMARARKLLQRRLIRRGLAPLAGVVAAGFETTPAPASVVAWRRSPVPPELVNSTIQAVGRVAAGESTARVVSGAAASLVERILWSMAMIKVKLSLGGAVLVGLMGSVAWFTAPDGPPARAQLESTSKPAPPHENVRAEPSEKSYSYNSVQGQTTVISFVPDRSLVKKGDVVCELDSAVFRDQLVNQKIAFLSALANYENARLDRETAEIAVVEYADGIYQIQLQESEGDIKIAEAELALAQDYLAALKSNHVTGPIEIKRAELAELRARFALEKAQSRKRVLVDFTRGKKIKDLKSAVDKAHSDELAKKAIWELEAQKEKKLERDIAACVVVAPRDGRVYPRVGQGTIIRGRQILFEIIPTPVAKEEGR
jgi:HlyD family secretion protein